MSRFVFIFPIIALILIVLFLIVSKKLNFFLFEFHQIAFKQVSKSCMVLQSMLLLILLASVTDSPMISLLAV